MKMLRTTSLFIACSLIFQPKTHPIDPFTGTLAAAAAGALVGGASYLLYDHAHYNSTHNCAQALEKLYRELYAENIFLRAAHAHSHDALCPLYKKIIAEEYNSGRSLRLSELTYKITAQAHQHINQLAIENSRIQRYAHYHDYNHAQLVEKCRWALHTLQDFYKNIEHSHGYSTISEQLLHELQSELRTTLNNYPHLASGYQRYPLHDYLKVIQGARGIYKKFVQDNRMHSFESDTIIHESDRTIQTLQKSSEFKLEEKSLEIERLKTENQALQNDLEIHKRKNNNLRAENDNLAHKNKRLNRLVQELKDIRCCRECQPHITICLHDLP